MTVRKLVLIGALAVLAVFGMAQHRTNAGSDSTKTETVTVVVTATAASSPPSTTEQPTTVTPTTAPVDDDDLLIVPLDGDDENDHYRDYSDSNDRPDDKSHFCQKRWWC